VNDPTWVRSPRPGSPSKARGTVYRSASSPALRSTSPLPPAAVASKRTAAGGRVLGRLALVALIIVSTTAAILVGYHLTTLAAHAAARTPSGASTDASGAPASTDAPVAPDPASPTAAASGTPKVNTATPGPLLAAGPVNVSVDGFLSWALMDRQTGGVTGSTNDTSATSSTESMIKIWIAADYLRRQAAAGNTPGQQRLDELTTMIRDSDDQAAEDIYRFDGGNDVVKRMISSCGLTGTTLVDGWWSKTQITARDATRLGLCVADGRAAGPTWTPWILTQMRQVRGEGRFGIIDALPSSVAGATAIKNGWTLIDEDGKWHVACLAVQDGWILAVLTRYDGSRGLTYGASVCANVTRQLLPDH
jgi:hypothetical protein